MRCLSSSLSVALAALLCCAAPAPAQDDAPAAPQPALGLMGTIPIYWGEAADVAELVGGQASMHWARPRLETRFALRPLDTLDDAGLADLDFLLLAQPRALSPAENVALDAWVRAGGHLLLFADPMLTGETRFAIGDRRRPQDVILLSPILGHWGLRLEFDVEHPEGAETVTAGDAAIPVNRPGRFAALAGGERTASSPPQASLPPAESARDRRPCWPTPPCWIFTAPIPLPKPLSTGWSSAVSPKPGNMRETRQTTRLPLAEASVFFLTTADSVGHRVLD